MRLGLDIGGTKTDAVVLDPDGAVLKRLRLPTGFGPEAVVASAVTAIENIADASGIDFESIGIGIPGMIDEGTGIVRHAVNLGFESLDLGAALAERLGVRVKVENDVKSAAVGAYHLLELQHPMAYLNLGTGLSAGIVINGALWRGARGTAGEIGHIPIDPAGALCPCGQRGCLETVASGSGITRQWPSDAEYPALELFEAATAGDERATAVVDALTRGVASAVRTLILTADVETVVIGGGLSHLGEPLFAGVRRVLQDWARYSPFLASLSLPTRVRVLPDGMPAAAVGAALIGVDHSEVSLNGRSGYRRLADRGRRDRRRQDSGARGGAP